MTSCEAGSSPGGANSTGFFCELHGLDVSSIQAYLDQCTQPFQESELYIVPEEKNVVDPSKRQSCVRRITDVSLFALVEPIVSQLNQEDSGLQYMLVRNDVAHIKYTEGGFFEKHHDYISVTSNMIEEFAMLVCVTPSEHVAATRGGKTVLHLHNGMHVSDATTTPGCALVFRKDVEHESTVLEAGEKHVITLNLWGWRKAEHRKGTGVAQVLLVTFPSTGRQAKSTEEIDLSKVASERSYALSVEEARLSPKLADFLETTAAKNQGAIVQYQCCDCEYEAFGTVFRVLRRMHVSDKEVAEHQLLLAAYGLKSTSALVMQIGEEGKEKGEPKATEEMPHDKYRMTIYAINGRPYTGSVSPSDTILSLRQKFEKGLRKEGLAFVMMEGGAEMLAESKTFADYDCPEQLQLVKRQLKEDEYEMLNLTWEELMGLMEPEPPAVLHHKGSDVIVCDSLERTRVVASIAKDAGLPYVSFEAIFVEADRCGDLIRDIPMSEAFMCVSDRRHVLSWWSCNWWEHGDMRVEQHDSLFNLSRVLTVETDVAALMPMLINRDRSLFYDHFSPHSEPLPGVMEATDCCWDDVDDGDDELASRGQGLFHIDSDGMTCFNREEAAATVKHLDTMAFEDQILSRLKNFPMAFQLPQHRERESRYLCNEDLYADMKFLLVSGVVRLFKEE